MLYEQVRTSTTVYSRLYLNMGPNLVFGTSGSFFVTDGRTDGRMDELKVF